MNKVPDTFVFLQKVCNFAKRKLRIMTPGVIILILLIALYIGWSLYLAVRVANNSNWAFGVIIFCMSIVITPLFMWIMCEATDYMKDTYFYYK